MWEATKTTTNAKELQPRVDQMGETELFMPEHWAPWQLVCKEEQRNIAVSRCSSWNETHPFIQGYDGNYGASTKKLNTCVTTYFTL